MKRPHQPSQSDVRLRLLEACAAFRKPPEFQIGDLVRAAPFIQRPGDSPTPSSEGVVFDTCPSLRKFTGDVNQPDAPGILVGFVSANDLFAYQWIGAWQYVPAADARPARLDA